MESAPRRARGDLRFIQAALLAASEVSWLWAWDLALGAAVGGSRGPALGLPAIVGLFLAAAAGARVAAGPRPGIGPRLALALLGLTAAVVAAAAGLPEAVQSGQVEAWWQAFAQSSQGLRMAARAGLVVLVWWRGIGIGLTRPSLYAAEAEFRTGVLAVGGLLALVAVVGKAASATAGALVLPTLVVVAVNLVAMPLSRIADTGEAPRHRGGPALVPGGPWLAMLLGVVGALLLATLLIAELLTFERISNVLNPLGTVLSAVIYVIILPFALIAALLLELVQFALAALKLRPDLTQQFNLGAFDQVRQQVEMAQGGGGFPAALKVAALVALAAAVVVLLVRAFVRRSGWRREDGVEEMRDFVWSWPGLGGIWRWLLAWLRPRLARPLPAPISARGARTPGESVRELYRDFLALGASIGRARRSAETPLEYESRLGHGPPLPGANEVSSITSSYVLARYAPVERASPDPGPVSAALARLRVLWQDRIGGGSG